MGDAIEEMIKVSAMYGLTGAGAVARFAGAVVQGDKARARVVWLGELQALSATLDDITNVEIEAWLNGKPKS